MPAVESATTIEVKILLICTFLLSLLRRLGGSVRCQVDNIYVVLFSTDLDLAVFAAAVEQTERKATAAVEHEEASASEEHRHGPIEVNAVMLRQLDSRCGRRRLGNEERRLLLRLVDLIHLSRNL